MVWLRLPPGRCGEQPRKVAEEGLSTQLWKSALGPERGNISLGNEVRISGNDCDTRAFMVSGESSFKDRA